MKINIINKNNNFDDFNNKVFIGRGSLFGNYTFSNKPSQYDLPKMPFKEGIKEFKKDIDKRFITDVKYKKHFNKLVDKLINNEEVTLECYCVNKSYSNIDEINRKKMKCHGEMIAIKLFEEVKLKLDIKTSPNNNFDLS